MKYYPNGSFFIWREKQFWPEKERLSFYEPEKYTIKFGLDSFLNSSAKIIKIDSDGEWLRSLVHRKRMDGVIGHLKINDYSIGVEDSYKDAGKNFKSNPNFSLFEECYSSTDDYLSRMNSAGYIGNFRVSNDKAALEEIIIRKKYWNMGIATGIIINLISNLPNEVAEFSCENIITPEKMGTYEQKKFVEFNLEKFRSIGKSIVKEGIAKSFEIKGNEFKDLILYL